MPNFTLFKKIKPEKTQALLKLYSIYLIVISLQTS
ncbi:hypothetical protein M2254_000532 [Chryseobacterium sp. BIGb0186]|nr:hypothetical protein [Chryseobacterium sp. JUb44]MDH6208948.1 hypothetical protein [Chryseobacterium sp. BIGb0186]